GRASDPSPSARGAGCPPVRERVTKVRHHGLPSARRSRGETRPPPARVGCAGTRLPRRRASRGSGSAWLHIILLRWRWGREIGLLSHPAQHCVLMTDDPSNEFQRLIAIV